MKKLGQVMLVGALALGGVGATSLAVPTQQASASLMDASTTGYSTTPNQYKHTFKINAQFEMNYYMYPAEFVVQTAAGKEVQNGYSRFGEGVGVAPDTVQYTTQTTTSDMSYLPAGDYKIIYDFFGHTDTQEFTINADRTITNK